MKSRPSKDQPIINENNTNVTQNVVEKETLEDLDIKIKKLMRSQPSISIDFHAFKDEYGLSNEGINPHRIKNKDVQKVALKEVFGAARRRSGYSFANCHNRYILDTNVVYLK
jgi:hypothetical protein